MTSGIPDAHRCNGIVLDPDNLDDASLLAELRADAGIEFIDKVGQQQAGLQELRPPPPPDVTGERTRWAFYPWRRAVVRILGPRAFRLVRLDRNRNLITGAELDRLGRLRIGVVGLSAGHAVAYTLAAQGLCGELRLTDFDDLELSNLNRVPASVFDLGVNKAAVCARRIAELDPYLPVTVTPSGIAPQTVGEFVDGLDIVIEECDSLDAKVLIREVARARHVPVLMATSDRGLMDVERFDIEPSRPILHGLLGDVDVAGLSNLASGAKVSHVLRILDGARLSARAAASLVEVGHTLSTWPQLAGDVVLGASVIAEAVRKIGLGESLPSGRVRIDISTALDHLSEPSRHDRQSTSANPSAQPTSNCADVVDRVMAAAVRAPSAGNAQPWHIEAAGDSITLRLAPTHSSTVDIGFRGSSVAVGAATYNARVAAAACGVRALVEFRNGDDHSPLHAGIQLVGGEDPDLAQLYPAMLYRETNRHRGTARAVDAETVGLLESAAHHEGARLRLLTTRSEIDLAAKIIAATDRVRYLTPHLHEEMLAELRWPGDPDRDSGIDVRSLELDSPALAMLDVLRRPDVMACLAQWDAGTALGQHTHDHVCTSSALGVVTVQGQTLVDYARGGSALEAVWILAQQRGLAVHPVSPLFLYAHSHAELHKLSALFAPSLYRLQQEFRDLADATADESHVIVLRFCEAPPASMQSRRRLGEIRAH
jgi:molybdopterin/thiamine biosynthesis adenylyltransferase